MARTLREKKRSTNRGRGMFQTRTGLIASVLALSAAVSTFFIVDKLPQTDNQDWITREICQ